MRIAGAALALLLAAGAAAAEAPCDAALPVLQRVECLKGRVEASERALVAERARIEGLMEGVPGLFPPARVRWRRALEENAQGWARLRNAECQDLAPFEAMLRAGGGAVVPGAIDRAPIDAEPNRPASPRAGLALGPRGGDLVVERLSCLAERNAARLADLRRRHPDRPPQR